MLYQMNLNFLFDIQYKYSWTTACTIFQLNVGGSDAIANIKCCVVWII